MLVIVEELRFRDRCRIVTFGHVARLQLPAWQAQHLEVQISWQAQRLVTDFVTGAALGEPRSADFVAGAALGEPRSGDFMAGAALGEPRSADFVAGTVLGEP